MAPYAARGVVALGGRPEPEYETARPWWFPSESDWVFGCAYEGLPDEVAGPAPPHRGEHVGPG